MNLGTRTELVAGDGWTSEVHDTFIVRYFNGRRYLVIENHNFMTAESGKRTLYWQHFHRYVALQASPLAEHHKVSYQPRTVQMSAPSLMGRTTASMVPDDNQSVPF